MPAVVRIFVVAEEGEDLAESVGEMMLSLNARHWDDSPMTMERTLGWLESSMQGQQGDELPLSEPSDTKDLGSGSNSEG